MLDTETWEDFAGTNADYAIGGPTAELFTKNSGGSFAEGIDIIDNDTNQSDNPYSISNRTDYSGSYWIASPRK